MQASVHEIYAMTKLDDVLPLVNLMEIHQKTSSPCCGEAAIEAQRAKDLRGLVAWLRTFESTLLLPEDRLAVERGHGLEMAAAAMERMLEEER